MTKLNNETRELTTDDLNAVAGGADWVPTGYATTDAYHVINEMYEDTMKVMVAAGLTKR